MKRPMRKFNSAKVFLVFNPAAGMALSSLALTVIKTFFASHRIPYEIYMTRKQDEIRNLIRTKIDEGFGKFIAAGGDGTVSLLADALAGTDIPFAIIPTGTGNLLARELQVPISTIKALQLALAEDHLIKSVDGMQLNDQRLYFLNISVGVSSELMQDTHQKEKRLLGRIGYITKFIKLTFKLLARTLVFDIDGEQHTLRSTEAILSNGKILAFPPFRWAEPSCLDDGKISFHILRAYTVRDVIRFALSVSPLMLRPDQTIRFFADVEDEIQIAAKQPLKVQADGDFVGFTPIRVRVMRNACKIIVPISQKIE